MKPPHRHPLALTIVLAALAASCNRADPAKAAALEQQCLNGVAKNTSGTSCQEACDLGSAKGCIEAGDSQGTGAIFMRDPGGIREGRELTLKGCKLQGDSEQTCQALKEYDGKYTSKVAK